MEQTIVSKQTSAFGVSLAVASVVNSLLVVAKEKNKSFMTGMAHGGFLHGVRVWGW
jgi:hypothetical protein